MRPPTLLIVLVVGATFVGCAKRDRVDVGEVANVPMRYDEAMVLRDWPRTEATYVGGGVVAGPSYFDNEYVGNPDSPRPGRSRGIARFTDGLVFLGNVALLPVRMVQDAAVVDDADAVGGGAAELPRRPAAAGG